MYPILDGMFFFRRNHLVTDVTQRGNVHSVGVLIRPCSQRVLLRRKQPVRYVIVNLPIAISPIICAFTLRRCAVA